MATTTAFRFGEGGAALYEGLRVTRYGATGEEARDGAVVEVALNRPARMNAISLVFWKAFRSCFEDIARDGSVRCVVVTGGESKHFTVGLDLSDEGIQSSMMQTREVGDGDPSRAAFAFRALAHQWYGITVYTTQRPSSLLFVTLFYLFLLYSIYYTVHWISC